MASEAGRGLSGPLHQLHAKASRSESLTTFDDLTSPPPTATANETKSLDMVQSGLSGLYSRLRASVGGSKEQAVDRLDNGATGATAGKNKATQKPVTLTKSPAGTAVSSPVVVSMPSSRLQSPLAPSFPHQPLPPSRDSNASSSAALSKPSFNASASSLGTSRSRPSIASTIDSSKPTADDESLSPSPHGTIPKAHAIVPFESMSKNNSAGGLVSASQSRDSMRQSIGRTERSQNKVEPDMADPDSDATEDDIVLIHDKPAPTERIRFPFPLDVTSEDLSRVTSRTESQYKSTPNSAKEIPGKSPETADKPRITSNAQTPVLAPAPQRPPMVSIGPSHLPGYHPSRMSSSDGFSSTLTSTTIRSPAVPPIEEGRAPSTRPSGGMLQGSSSHMPRKLLGREYWMRDENAKDCFNCGDAFSTFRRKHHCRTCGQIFDSKCTSIIPGKHFGQPMNIRVCKPCEDIIYGHNDDSSEYTDDGDQASLYDQDDHEVGVDQFDPSESDHTKIGTPTISIPMSRKSGSEKKRRSAVIEVAPQLPRPSSSRSLRSLSGRPRSSSHKRYNSRHQHMRSIRYEDRAPFHQYHTEHTRSRSALPVLHHDNIIDPDLAPFLSDEGSSEDEAVSIFATLRGDSPSHTGMDSERGGIGGLLAAMRKGKGKNEKGGTGGGHTRDADSVSITGRQAPFSRRRNPSVSSVTHRPSPRRSKSNSLLKPFGAGTGGTSPSPQQGNPHHPPAPSSASKITRSASMQGGNAPQMELNQASLEHVRRLLKQMLQDDGLSHLSSWEKALVPILLQCTDDVNPDLHRGDDIDIRHYIKLKKIPGGRPRDTSYVSGVIFSKNIALKSMPRNIPHPRILIITFAIEYARHQTHFMSLEPVIAQEREYLRNLVGRIVALKPNVLFVQRNVSGLALEFLERAGVAVAYNVKETVLNAVARCTQSKPVSSVDQLADMSRLGKCGSFDVKTYVHKKTKKNYIFLSGCQPDLGCTIALRGDETRSLAKLKRITEFMCYVVYNLKLETCLMRDEFVLIPTVSDGGLLASNQSTVLSEKEAMASAEIDNTQTSTTEISTATAITNVQVPQDAAPPSFYSEMVENHRTKILSASPFVKFMQPYLLNQAREYETKLGYLKQLRDQYTTDDVETEGNPQNFELVQPEMVHVVVDQASKQVREFLHAVHASEYDKALHHYRTQKRQWEAYLATNMELFDPFNHQKIAVLYSVVNTAYSTPCIGPDIIALNFYQEHDFVDGFTPDCTLGQYVEDLCHSAGMVCEVDGCNRRMLDHSRQYVHGEGQMSVIVQKYPSKIKGLQSTILMWSCCRICGQETQVIPMSDSTWKYSFAKYLELTFWSSQLHPRAGLCPHDIHKNHVRYFGFNNVALRVQYDSVSLYEVTVPRPIVTWKVDSDLRLKNDQFLKIEDRLDQFMASVRSRIKSIHVESVIPEKVELCKAEVDKLLKRANDEHEWLRAKLQNKYMNSKYYEIIPMNRAIRAIQEKAIAWDETFTEFEQQYFPSEKDIRRLATLQLKKLFLERDESTSSLTSVDEGLEDAEESMLDEKGEPIALPPMPSSMSPERARDMLNSVVEEHSHGNAPSEQAHALAKDDSLPLVEPKDEQILQSQRPYNASQRDNVRHLDLAMSSSMLPDHSAVANEEGLKTPTLAAEDETTESETTTPVALPRLDPIDKSVTDAIDHMPSSAAVPDSPNASLESRIPRLVDTIRREVGSYARPGMIRTQSQPGAVPKSSNAPHSASMSHTLDSSFRKTGSDPLKAIDRLSERLSLSFKQSKSTSKIPRSIPASKVTKDYSKVSKLAEHFEQLSREFQKERMRERKNERRRQARAYPLASSKPIVEVYKDVHEAVQEQTPSDEELQTSSPPRASTDNSTLGDSALTEANEVTSVSDALAEERQSKALEDAHQDEESEPETPGHPPSDMENDLSDAETAPEDVPLPDSIANSDLLSMTESQLENSLELPRHEKTTLMKMLTSFWSERSASGWAPLDYPFAQIEHVWEDSDIIVREDEPSSIIALALSAPDYVTKLQSFRGESSGPKDAGRAFETLEESIERNLLHEKNTNIRYGFNNRGVRAQCKIFYAQSFDALRRKCGVADRFVESLSRCSKWDSKGGKSKSIFLKTLDERFVLKSLSPIEVQAFFRFAPNYFAFTHQNLFKGLPSVIAKMFGLFQVQIKTPTGRDFDWFMLVMENLFYDREPNRRYDLKGSMRNRKIESTGEADEVLLDENLVEIIYSETPIFVREHTKKLLKASVWNDTLFLSQNNVMDYSLMAGFDDTNHDIIVGIIGKHCDVSL